MSLKRNYYEVLGVPQEATTHEIKKKYRELARKFHPDVVQDKDLGQRVFSQINQAYRVLADDERRAQYNSTLASGDSAAPATAQSQTRPSASSSSASHSSASNGTGHRPGEPPGAQKTQAITGLLGNAENASMAGKPLEARAFCVKVLEIDPRQVRALELLGDALSQMGQREDAAVQYRKALQVAPSHSIQAKLTRMEQAGPSTRTIPPGQTAAAGQTLPRTGQTPPPKPPAAPGAGAAHANGSQSNGSKTNGAQSGGEKAGGLLGRLLGRK